MGTELDVFYLLRFSSESPSCEHHLLIRARRQAYSNAIQPEEDAAGEHVERQSDAIKADYLESILRAGCAATHVETLVGELQVTPVGDELYADERCERSGSGSRPPHTGRRG